MQSNRHKNSTRKLRSTYHKLPIKFCLLCTIVVWCSLPAFSQAISSAVYTYNQALVANHSGYQERTLAEGTTRNYSHLLVKAITLPPNQPAQPVQQLDEEVALIVKSGELTLTLGTKRKTLGSGSFAMVMPGDEYRVDNKAAQPLTYYLIQYASNEVPDLDLYRLAGSSYWVDWQETSPTTNQYGSSQRVVPYPSIMSDRIVIQLTKLKPNLATQHPHTQRAAEFIMSLDQPILLHIDGALKKANAGDLIFVESGIPHAIQADQGCTYLSFQF